MKFLNFFLLLLFTFSLITGCASSPPRDKVPAEKFTPRVYYAQKTEPGGLTLKEQEAIRKDTITIKFEIRQDGGGHWFIDMNQFEAYGIKAGERIEWVCSNNIPFTVYFGWVSPFEKDVYPAENIKGEVYRTEVAWTRERYPLEAKAVEFKYTIAAAVEYIDTVTNKKKTEVIVYDPLMYLQPPGSGQH